MTDANSDHEFYDLDDLTPDQWIRLLNVVASHARAAAKKSRAQAAAADISQPDPNRKVAEKCHKEKNSNICVQND